MNLPVSPLKDISGGHVLDVASGYGGSIQFLIENLPSYEEIVGIDIKVIDDANRSTFDGKNVQFMRMDAAQMNFADASFDTVCIAHSLHHLSNLPGTLVEMKRVLKPGGYFIITEMYCDDQTETQLTHVYLHHWWGAVDKACGVSHNETFTRKQILDLVNELTLQNVTIDDVSNLEDDPKAPKKLKHLNEVIDKYIKRAQGLPNQAKLAQRGEALRQRVHEIGLHGASAILVVGQKPN